MIRLEADPAEVAGAVDVAALLERVLVALRLTPEELATVRTALTAQPCVLEVRPGAEIDDAIQRIRGGLCGRHKGVTLSTTRVWVLRLDWPGLLGHELAHVIRRILHQPEDEAEARRVADAVG